MYTFRQLFVALWCLGQLAVVFCISVFVGAFLHLRFDEMHTVSTAMDPDPSLTREQVISNVLIYTLGWAIGATVLATIVFAINAPLLKDIEDINGKKVSVILALICWLWMLFLLLYLGINCYRTYGANLPA